MVRKPKGSVEEDVLSPRPKHPSRVGPACGEHHGIPSLVREAESDNVSEALRSWETERGGHIRFSAGSHLPTVTYIGAGERSGAHPLSYRLYQTGMLGERVSPTHPLVRLRRGLLTGLCSSSFNSLPGLKYVFLRAGTYMISPVRGFRAAGFGFVSFTPKTPNPRISIRLPAINVSRIAAKRASTIPAAMFFLNPVTSLTFNAKSLLVVVIEASSRCRLTQSK